MSVDRNYYVIAGYDLTDFDTDKYKDWIWSDDGEKYRHYQSKGHIQFFDDPMSGDYLYFGYVLADGDEYEFEASKFKVDDINAVYGEVNAELIKLIELGVISKDPRLKPDYQIIAFVECT